MEGLLVMKLYGAEIPFDVEHNVNKISMYPNDTMEPSLDRYTCQYCHAVIEHTQDGCFMDRNEAEDKLYTTLKRHIELCQLVQARS